MCSGMFCFGRVVCLVFNTHYSVKEMHLKFGAKGSEICNGPSFLCVTIASCLMGPLRYEEYDYVWGDG